MTEELRFLVPDGLADELEAAGLVSTRSDMEYRGAADVGVVALIVYNVTVTTLTLAEMPGQIVALRDSIARWVRKSPPDQRPYSLGSERDEPEVRPLFRTQWLFRRSFRSRFYDFNPRPRTTLRTADGSIRNV